MRPLYSHLVHTLPSLFSILLVLRPASAQDGHVPRCYYPDGTLASNDYACRLNTTESFCCTTNVTCLDNKICQVLAPTQYEYNRGTCTDKTWTSDECPKFCQAQSPSYGSGVIRCASAGGEVCCDNDNKDATAKCCQDDSNLFPLPGDWDVFRTIDRAASSMTRSVGESSSTETGIAGQSSAAETAGSKGSGQDGGAGLQTGAIVGIAVGGVAGVVGIGILALLIVRRKKKRWASQPMTAELDGFEMRHELKADEAPTRHEIDGRDAPQELSSGDERHEMEGSSPLDQKLMEGSREVKR